MSAQEVLEQYLVASFGDKEGKIVAGEIRDTLRAAGYVVVPREPTPGMLAAGIGVKFTLNKWRAMLSAAEGDAP
jgi:hypothetical protein